MPQNTYRNREIVRETCIRGFTGLAEIKSAFFDASTLTENSEGRFEVPIGSFLTKSTTEPTKVKIFEKLGTNTNAVQTLTETGSPTGGTFTITYNGVTSGAIKYNASITEIAEALIKMSTFATSENVAVTSTESKPINEKAAKIEFKGELGNQSQPLLVINSAGLTGGATPAVTPTTTTPGTTAEEIIGVFNGPQKEFWGNTISKDEPIPIYFHSVSFDIKRLPQWTQYGLLAKEALKNCTFF
jgi:hypothetical protein